MRLLRLSFWFAASLLFVSGGMLPAQKPVVLNPPATATASSEGYAGESFVIERLDLLYAMNADGTGYREKTVVVKVQSDAALRAFGVIGIPFASASEHVEIKYARVRRADGTVIETPASDAQEQPEQVTVQAPFYSDLKQVQLPVKSLRVGDTLEWQARIVRTKAEAPGQFWGGDSFLTEDMVVTEESIELRVPVGTAVTVWTDPRLGVKAKETVDGGQKVYRWEDAALKPTVGKEADAAKALKKKTLLTAEEQMDVDEGKLPSVAWTTFKSWAAVGAWYRELEGDRTAPDAAVKAKVAELTAGETTEEEKVRAVYGYVSSQIRYIGVAFGVGRYQPHRAGDVLDNQYGDCKDKHTLLASMLTAIGLQPDAVLIGAGIRFNEAVPSPSAFNHLITRVKVGGQEVWLDSTEEIAPYKMMYAVIRDKQALVVPDVGMAAIDRTPADPPFASFQNWKAVGTLDAKGVSESHISFEVRGDGELSLREAVRQVAPAQYEEFMQNLAHNIGYAGTSSHAEISRPDDTAGPLTMSFDYHREQAGDWDNLRIIPQLAPMSLPSVDEKEPPVAAIDLGGLRTETSRAEMKLPAGWGVELPEAVHEKAAFATYDLTYKFDKGTLITEQRIVVLEKKVPAADWKTYKKWQDAIGSGNWGYVQLTRGAGNEAGPAAIGAGKGAAKSAPVTAFNEDAQKLIQQAMDALLKKNDMTTATSLLDQAKKLNPQQKMLWAAYGSVAYMRGMPFDAMTDYQKELNLHPDSYWVYGAMAETQRLQGDKEGAETTLRNWSVADPSDPNPPTQLMAMLLSENKAGEAAKAADAALVNLPTDKRDNPRLQLEIGEAQVKAGMADKGSATLMALLKASDDPMILNSAAYLLADAKMELPLTDVSERKVLDKLTTETASWTMDESPQTLKQQSGLLVASWDTMGWILFREGKTKEAEPYIEAAWLNDLHSEVGGHLVQVRAALGETSGARVDKKAKADPNNPEPGKSQQELRTVKLGPAGGRDGVAEYRLLISRAGVERAEAVGDKTVDRGKELLEKVKLPGYVPQDSQAKVVRDGMLNCHSGECELVFLQ